MSSTQQQQIPRILVSISLPDTQHKLYSWKIRNGSSVRVGETVALAVLAPGTNIATNTTPTGSDLIPSTESTIPPPPSYKRPTKRKRPGAGTTVTATTIPSMSATTIDTTKSDRDDKEQGLDEHHRPFNRIGSLVGKNTTMNIHDPKYIPIVAQASGIVRVVLEHPPFESINASTPDILVIGFIEQCEHPTVVEGLCAVCGEPYQTKPSPDGNGTNLHYNVMSDFISSSSNKPYLGPEEVVRTSEQPVGHNPSMSRITVSGGITVTVSEEEGQRIAQQDAERLRKQRKLSLVLDLDHTLVHATNDLRAQSFMMSRNDVRCIVLPMLEIPATDPAGKPVPTQQPRQQLWMPHFVKLRPYLKEFLDNVAPLYEIGVYTAGTREYAEHITLVLARHMVGAQRDQVDLQDLRQTVAAAEAESKRVKEAVQLEERAIIEPSASRIEDSFEDNDQTDKKTHIEEEESSEYDAPPCNQRAVRSDALTTDQPDSPMESEGSIGEASEPDQNSKLNHETAKRDKEELPSDGGPASLLDSTKAEREQSTEANSPDIQNDAAEIKLSKNRKRVTFGELPPATKTDHITKPQLLDMQRELAKAEHLESMALETRQKLFGSRIVSRTDVGDLGRDVKSLKRIFPCGGTMAAVVDDREDVWANAGEDNEIASTTSSSSIASSSRRPGEPPENLLLVRPYHWAPFVGFADVNNAAGVDYSASGGGWRDDPTSTVETDCQLLWTGDILKRLHSSFYNDEMEETRTVPAILRQMREQVLAGTKLILSGLVPLHKQTQDHQEQNDVPRPPVVRYAEALGATLLSQVCSGTTHVVAAKDGTDKILAARRIPGCLVVRVSWLMECLWSLTRRDEARHLLLRAPTAPPPSPSATATALGALTESSSGRSSSLLQRTPLTTSTMENASSGGSSSSSSENTDGDDDDDDDWAAELENEILEGDEGE